MEGELQVPEIIGEVYEIIDRIGSGGGGVVYLANHLRLNKKVVLKADKRQITTRPEILRREVDVLKNLSHTYIPQVYDFFVEQDTVYTVMDYIEGESLDRPLKRGEVFSQPQIIKWACELLEALSYLHSPTHGEPPHGIVHSDIKPANIMRTPQGNICLIDFNIALALGEENVVGRSAGYSSPEHYGLDFSTDTEFTNSTGSTETEVMTDGESTVPMHSSENTYTKKTIIPDARSDIYSLGATLYHMISGEKPHKDAQKVIPLSGKEYNPQIIKIITKAMSPNPDLRYQSADEMLQEFRNLRKNDPRVKRFKRISVIAGLVLAVTLIAGSFTSFIGLKRRDSINESLAAAEYARNALEEGNIDLAIDYAIKALPSENGLFSHKYVSSARKALADAMGVYDLSDGYKPAHMVELPSEAFKAALSPNGEKGVALYSFEAAIFNTITGEIISTLPIVQSALADAAFIDDDTLIYAGDNGISCYNIEKQEIVWTGKQATHIAVSADKKTIAAVYRDEKFATVYDINGNEKLTVPFGDKKQRVVNNDTFADPKDNLLSLSADGKFLSVSFDNGGLYIYDTTDIENDIEIYDVSDYTHFEGGFSGQYFAFSSTNEKESVFAIIDMAKLLQDGGFSLDSRIGVAPNEDGIFISNKSTAVKIQPTSGNQEELAYADADITSFKTNSAGTIVTTTKNDYIFYDKQARLLQQENAGQTKCDFVDIAGEYAIIAGMDTPKIRILQKKDYTESEVFKYDEKYEHDEARIKSDGTTVTLFNYKKYNLFNIDGTLIKSIDIPDADKVYDQQYSNKSGNLAVMYDNALRIYSGVDGSVVFEATDLNSVFYAAYGISILDKNGCLKLIDIDSGEMLEEYRDITGKYAAYCGVVVDDSILDGGELIGAAKINDSYIYAVNHNGICSVYNGNKDKLFEMPVSEQSEAFFTSGEIIISPLHGTPEVYSISAGKKVADLEKDTYLTYITQLDDAIMSEYVSASGERYGILLDKDTYQPIAQMQGLTDVYNGELIFDYHRGSLRKTHIYSTDELLNQAKTRNDD